MAHVFGRSWQNDDDRGLCICLDLYFDTLLSSFCDALPLIEINLEISHLAYKVLYWLRLLYMTHSCLSHP